MNNNRLSAQITLAWDGTTLRAEMPGTNGSRRKVETATFDDLPLWLKTELITEIERQRDRAAADLRQRQNENISYVVDRHGKQVAKKLWSNGELAFNRSWKKYLAGEVGNTGPVQRGAKANNGPSVSSETLDRLNISQAEIKKGLDL